MNNNLYVISGATGMTGSELSRRLVAENNLVIGFDNFFASSIETVKDIIDNPNFVFYEYDINNEKQMNNVATEIGLKKKSYNGQLIFVNCAAVVHTKHFYEVEHTFQTNVLSMKKFLDMSIALKADIFINCSTSEVYSMQSWNETGGVKEDDYLLMSTAEHSQRTSYAVGKLLTEFFMKDVVDKNLIKGCSIRFANVYSKHERFAEHIIPHIIDNLLDGKQVVLLENSKVNRRTFLHNIDSCRAVMELIKTPIALDGTIYNVATNEEISIVDLTKLIAKKMGMNDVDIRFEGYRKSDPERRLLNTDKIRTRTSWQPIISLDEGLEMCIKSIEK